MKYFASAFLIALSILSSCKTKNKELENRVEVLEEKAANNQAIPPTNESIVSTSENKAKGPLAEISFEKKSYDFGDIKEGEKVKHTFTFTNTGKSPLLIQNASASCGCTVPDWPHEPIAPGKSGKIDVQFDSHGKSGPQNKTISITANTNPEFTVLTLVGTVAANNSDKK